VSVHLLREALKPQPVDTISVTLTLKPNEALLLGSILRQQMQECEEKAVGMPSNSNSILSIVKEGLFWKRLRHEVLLSLRQHKL
jgi:hypothetical protein